MKEESRRAWVAIPGEEEIRSGMPSDKTHHYDFGFLPVMGGLLRAHAEIGPLFGALYHEVMIGPGRLDRREREMVAAIASAAQDCHY